MDHPSNFSSQSTRQGSPSRVFRPGEVNRDVAIKMLPEGLARELVECPTLEDRLASGPLPQDRACPIARRFDEALEAAHERGTLHRDLEPGRETESWRDMAPNL